MAANSITPDRLTAIRARLAQATPGPWEADGPQLDDDAEQGVAVIAVHPDVPKGMTPTRGMVAWVGEYGANFGLPEVRRANADLIAHAPEDLRDLLAALDAVTQARDEIREQLDTLRRVYPDVVASAARADRLYEQELSALTAERDAYRAALELFASREHWVSAANDVTGFILPRPWDLARAALAFTPAPPTED